MITPGTNPVVVEKNLEQMINPHLGGMIYVLLEEGKEGNVRNRNGLMCSRADFIFNKYTGQIALFDNYKDIPSKKSESKSCGSVGVAIDFTREKGKDFRIISYFLEDKGLCSFAQKNIEASIKRFNDEYGFSEHSLLKVLK